MKMQIQELFTCMGIGGGGYEARRLVPPQNLGPGCTPCHYGVCLPEFLTSNAVRPQVDAFCGTKNKKSRFRPGLSCGPHWMSLRRSPRSPSWLGGGLAAPILKNIIPCLGPLGLELRPFGHSFSVLPHFWLHSTAPVHWHITVSTVTHNIAQNSSDYLPS